VKTLIFFKDLSVVLLTVRGGVKISNQTARGYPDDYDKLPFFHRGVFSTELNPT